MHVLILARNVGGSKLLSGHPGTNGWQRELSAIKREWIRRVSNSDFQNRLGRFLCFHFPHGVC